MTNSQVDYEQLWQAVLNREPKDKHPGRAFIEAYEAAKAAEGESKRIDISVLVKTFAEALELHKNVMPPYVAEHIIRKWAESEEDLSWLDDCVEVGTDALYNTLYSDGESLSDASIYRQSVCRQAAKNMIAAIRGKK